MNLATRAACGWSLTGTRRRETLPATDLRKIPWNFCVVCLNAPKIVILKAQYGGRFRKRVESRCGEVAFGLRFHIPLIEPDSRFVTSTTAPIATGWSESCRMGFAPLNDRAFPRRTKYSTLISWNFKIFRLLSFPSA